MRRRHFIRALTASVLLLAGRVLLGAADQPATVVRGGNSPGMKGVIYHFFDDQTGGRIGQLQIGKVGVEYQRRGFFRVAWDPLVVLDGVTIEICAGVAWPQAGAKIIDALRVTGRQNASVLRQVRLRLDGAPSREITAVSASLRPDGGLELAGAALSGNAASGVDAGAGSYCFWLAGPNVGQLIANAPAGTAVARSLSAKQVLTHPAP